MKRIIAIVLTLMMLMGMAALAEEAQGTAAIMMLDNIHVESGGQQVDADGLVLSLAIDAIDGVPSIIGMIDGNNEALFTAVLQLVGNKLVFAWDGSDVAYSEDVPAQFASQVSQISTLGPYLPMLLSALDNVALPPLSGTTIPKFDLRDALAGFMTGDTFTISYETINQLLDSLLQTVSDSNMNVAGLDQMIAMIQQMRSNGMGIEITGHIEDSADTQTVYADIHLVQDNTVDEEAIAGVVLSSAENDAHLGIAANLGTGLMDIAALDLKSDPDARTISFEMSMAGMITANFSAYPEDDMNYLSFALNGAGQDMNLAFGYGQVDDLDVVSLSASASSAGSVVFTVASSMGSDAVRRGVVELNAAMNGETVNLSADLTMYNGAVIDLGSFTVPTDVRGFDELDTDALNAALQPVTDYLDSIAPAA